MHPCYQNRTTDRRKYVSQNPYAPPPPPPPMPPQPVGKPATLVWAVRGMYAGAVPSFIGVLLTLLMRDETEKAVRDEMRDIEESGLPIDTDVIVTISIGLGVVVGVVATCLWIWIAVMNDRGRNWARVTGTVFGGVHLATSPFALIQSASASVLTLALNLLTTGLVVAILVLLWRPASSAYFRARSAQRP